MESESDPKARFNITMGSVDGIRITQKHSVYIDDIVLEEIKDTYPVPKPAADDNKSENEPSNNTVSDNTASDNSVSDNKPCDNRNCDDKTPSKDSSSDNKPSKDTPSDNTPSDNKPADEVPSDKKTDDNTSSENIPVTVEKSGASFTYNNVVVFNGKKIDKNSFGTINVSYDGKDYTADHTRQGWSGLRCKGIYY